MPCTACAVIRSFLQMGVAYNKQSTNGSHGRGIGCPGGFVDPKPVFGAPNACLAHNHTQTPDTNNSCDHWDTHLFFSPRATPPVSSVTPNSALLSLCRPRVLLLDSQLEKCRARKREKEEGTGKKNPSTPAPPLAPEIVRDGTSSAFPSDRGRTFFPTARTHGGLQSRTRNIAAVNELRRKGNGTMACLLRIQYLPLV